MTLHDIESAAAKLPPKEFKEFWSWFDEPDADEWNKKFEADTCSGEIQSVSGAVLPSSPIELHCPCTVVALT
jgi:hypothetical protein